MGVVNPPVLLFLTILFFVIKYRYLAFNYLGGDTMGRPREKTDDVMLDNLRRLAKELGRSPTMKEVDRCWYCASAQTYRNRFGKFSYALREAGLKK